MYTEHKASVAATSGSRRRAGNLSRGLGEAEGGRTRPSGKQSGGCRGPKTSVSKMNEGNSLVVVQWLGFHTSTAGGTSSIRDQETNIPHAKWGSQKKIEAATEQLRIWESRENVFLLEGGESHPPKKRKGLCRHAQLLPIS